MAQADLPATPVAATEVRLTCTINGRPVQETVPARLLLVDFLRRRLRLTGTHVGCDTSTCGACTVLLNGAAVKSCTVLAVQVEGQSVTTVEGITPAQGLNPLQAAFQRHHALQCGYCTPGMLLAATALLAEAPHPDEAQIRRAIAGNLCRCTGYQHIVDAIAEAAGTVTVPPEGGERPWQP